MAAANQVSSKYREIAGKAQGSFKQYFGFAHCNPREQKKVVSPRGSFMWSKCNLQFRRNTGLESEVEALGNLI